MFCVFMKIQEMVNGDGIWTQDSISCYNRQLNQAHYSIWAHLPGHPSSEGCLGSQNGWGFHAMTQPRRYLWDGVYEPPLVPRSKREKRVKGSVTGCCAIWFPTALEHIFKPSTLRKLPRITNEMGFIPTFNKFMPNYNRLLNLVRYSIGAHFQAIHAQKVASDYKTTRDSFPRYNRLLNLAQKVASDHKTARDSFLWALFNKFAVVQQMD
ncbi:hypothetical protein C8R45DRAFT_932393 [Mycena sanguinolenta]|nr:hypothetical protein C8R45DRAFT_932393 [Mycena sanguinolenta]